MKKRDMANSRFFVGQQGGEIRCVSPDGEIKWCVGLSGGVHHTDVYRQYMFDGDAIEVTGSVTIQSPGGRRLKAQPYGPGGSESGANPDFRPSTAATHQRQLDLTLRKITEQSKGLERRMKSFERLARDQQAQRSTVPPADTDPVPDPESAPEPDPDAAKQKKADKAAE